MIICYSSKGKLTYTILWESKYKIPCITEQLLTLCCGEKDEEAVKELRTGKEICVYFLLKILSDPECWSKKT